MKKREYTAVKADPDSVAGKGVFGQLTSIFEMTSKIEQTTLLITHEI
jgi:hypothetical protein